MKHVTETRYCDQHGTTEYYVYYYRHKHARCKQCAIEARRARPLDPVTAEMDRAASKNWQRRNKSYVSLQSKLKVKAKGQEILQIQQEVFQAKVAELREIFQLWKPTKSYTDPELIEASLEISQSLKAKFSWDRFVTRMKTQIRNTIMRGESVKMKTREGWIKMVDGKMQYRWNQAPQEEKDRLNQQVQQLTRTRYQQTVQQLDLILENLQT